MSKAEDYPAVYHELMPPGSDKTDRTEYDGYVVERYKVEDRGVVIDRDVYSMEPGSRTSFHEHAAIGDESKYFVLDGYGVHLVITPSGDFDVRARSVTNNSQPIRVPNRAAEAWLAAGEGMTLLDADPPTHPRSERPVESLPTTVRIIYDDEDPIKRIRELVLLRAGEDPLLIIDPTELAKLADFLSTEADDETHREVLASRFGIADYNNFQRYFGPHQSDPNRPTEQGDILDYPYRRDHGNWLSEEISAALGFQVDRDMLYELVQLDAYFDRLSAHYPRLVDALDMEVTTNWRARKLSGEEPDATSYAIDRMLTTAYDTLVLWLEADGRTDLIPLLSR